MSLTEKGKKKRAYHGKTITENRGRQGYWEKNEREGGSDREGEKASERRERKRWKGYLDTICAIVPAERGSEWAFRSFCLWACVFLIIASRHRCPCRGVLSRARDLALTRYPPRLAERALLSNSPFQLSVQLSTLLHFCLSSHFLSSLFSLNLLLFVLFLFCFLSFISLMLTFGSLAPL